MPDQPDRVTFGGEPCLDPGRLALSLSGTARPVPDEIGLANSFASTLGTAPGTGHVLLTRQSLSRLNLNATDHQIVFHTPPLAPVVVCNLVIADEPRRVSFGPTGAANSPGNVFLVQVADRRHLAQNVAFRHADELYYNLPAYSYPANFHTFSRNAGSDWTWLTMIQDLWDRCGVLGTAPSSLPYTPDGTPVGWAFPGVSVLAALGMVLDRLSLALRHDPSTGAFDLVELGASDATHAAKVNTYRLQRAIEDDDFVNVIAAAVPANVRVYFHVRSKHPGSEQVTTRGDQNWFNRRIYWVDRPAPDATGTVADLYHPLWDDLEAVYDAFANTWTNTAALGTRADERRDKFYQAHSTAADFRYYQVYGGAIDFRAGSRCRGVAWRQEARPNGSGGWVCPFVTEIVNQPEPIHAGEGGRFVRPNPGERAAPPWFQPPGYVAHAPIVAPVKITASASGPAGNLDDGVTVRYDPDADAVVDGDTVLAKDLNADGA